MRAKGAEERPSYGVYEPLPDLILPRLQMRYNLLLHGVVGGVEDLRAVLDPLAVNRRACSEKKGVGTANGSARQATTATGTADHNRDAWRFNTPVQALDKLMLLGVDHPNKMEQRARGWKTV